MEAASIGTGSPARVQRSKGLQEKQLARLMVAPSMILIAVVAAWPVIYAVWPAAPGSSWGRAAA